MVTVLVTMHPFAYASVASTEEHNINAELSEWISEDKEVSTEREKSSISSMNNQEEENKEGWIEEKFYNPTLPVSESLEETMQDSIIEEAKIVEQPSMIADRSNEGQPLTQGTTFRGVDKAKRNVSFRGYNIEVDENSKVTVTQEIQNLVKALDSKVESVLAVELLNIESENVLFVYTKQGKNKPTKVFPENPTSALKGKFKGMVTKDIVTLKAHWDEATIVAPSWVDTTKLSNKTRAGFHTVTINGKEAFTVKTDDFGWFYVKWC